jgi:hypothetical protein
MADTLVARRLDVATQGAVQADGSLALDVSRVVYERRDGKGTVSTLTTEVVAATADKRTAEDVATTRLLEALRASSLRIGLDATNGVTSVEGIDRAFDAAVAADASLADERVNLRNICSDDGWCRGLSAAGLCALPGAGSAKRAVRLRVPGLGDTTLELTGESGADDGGTPAFRYEGKLRADTVFEGEPGATNSFSGPAEVAGVSGEATTSYPSRGAMPSKGQWSLSVPFANHLAVKTTTTFTLVRN